MDFYKKKRDLNNESSAEQVAQNIFTSSSQRWKRDLSQKDKETVKEIAGNILISLGYAENNDW